MPKPSTGGGAPASRERGEQRAVVERQLGVGAGDPGARDAIGVARRQAGDPRQRRRRRVGRGDHHQVDARRARRGGIGRGLDARHVGDQQAVDPRRRQARRKRSRCRAPRRCWHRSGCRPARRHGARGSAATSSRQCAVRTPAPSARSAAAWITGPSATGSLNGMPSSTMSAPPSTSASSKAALVVGIGIAEHQEGAERALARGGAALEHRGIAAHARSPQRGRTRPEQALRLRHVLVAASRQIDQQDRLVVALLGQLQRMGQRVAAFERADDALRTAPARRTRRARAPSSQPT